MNIAEQLFNLMMQRPEAKNNPMAQELARLVKAGDAAGIEKMGRNLCQTYNIIPLQEIIYRLIKVFPARRNLIIHC